LSSRFHLVLTLELGQLYVFLVGHRENYSTFLAALFLSPWSLRKSVCS